MLPDTRANGAEEATSSHALSQCAASQRLPHATLSSPLPLAARHLSPLLSVVLEHYFFLALKQRPPRFHLSVEPHPSARSLQNRCDLFHPVAIVIAPKATRAASTQTQRLFCFRSPCHHPGPPVLQADSHSQARTHYRLWKVFVSLQHSPSLFRSARLIQTFVATNASSLVSVNSHPPHQALRSTNSRYRRPHPRCSSPDAYLPHLNPSSSHAITALQTCASSRIIEEIGRAHV